MAEPRVAAAYTPEQRQAAIARAQQIGTGKAARELGVKRGTLAAWVNRAGLTAPSQSERTAAATAASLQHREALRVRVHTKLLRQIDRLLDRMDQPHVDFKGSGNRVTYPKAPAAAVQNYATSVGILIDKYRLEMGEATSRSESRDLTHDDHERELLRDAIKSELARRSAESARRSVDGDAAAGADAPAVADDAPAGAGAA